MENFEELSNVELLKTEGGSEFSDAIWFGVGAGLHYAAKGLYLLAEGASAIQG